MESEFIHQDITPPSLSKKQSTYEGSSPVLTKTLSSSVRQAKAFRLTPGTYRAALIGSAPLMPVVATLITIALYIAIPQSLYSKLIATAGGFVLMLFIWLLIAIFFAPSTTATGADMYSYHLLSSRFERLSTCLTSLQSDIDSSRNLLPLFQTTSMEEMSTHLTLAANLLYQGGGSMTWVSGIGYVNLSRLLNRAEENLIMFGTQEEVIANGNRIEITLENTTISNKDFFHRALESALDTLIPQRTHLTDEPNVKKSHQVSTHAVKLSAKSSARASMRVSASMGDSKEKMIEARTIIHVIANWLHEFQDDQWEKLVHVRNQLRNLITMTGLVLLFLLEFAILIGFSSLTMISATFFFLTGAGVGLFSRLYEQARVDRSIDDVRLAGVRLMAAPLFSGLAGIGGVAVMQKVAVSSGTISFDLTLFNILAAAAFGLAPNLFFNSLRRQVDSADRDKKA